MSGYQPAILIEMVDNEPSFEEIKGGAVILISRNERGVMEASGTFRSTDKRLRDPERLPKMLFQYKGAAFEGDKHYEISAVMVVKNSQGELYELEASTEPVNAQRLDTTSKPVTFDNLLEFDPTDN